MSVDNSERFVTYSDPETRYVTADFGRLGGQYNPPTKSWVFPGSEYTVHGQKKFSSPHSDKADALLELYHATRPTEEQMTQLRETAAVVPPKVLGITAKSGSAEAKKQLAALLNPNLTSRAKAEYLLTRSAGYAIEASATEKEAVALLIDRGYDEVAWGFNAKTHPEKVWAFEGSGPNQMPTVARAMELINLATPFVRADQYRADQAMLAGELEDRGRGIDRTKLGNEDEFRRAERLAAERGTDDARLSAFENRRYTGRADEGVQAEPHVKLGRKRVEGTGAVSRRAEQEARELGKDADRQGFGVRDADLRPQTALERARGSLEYQAGMFLEGSTAPYSRDEVILREPRVGTTIKGTAQIFVKVEGAVDDQFLIGVQHKTSQKTFTILDSKRLDGYNISNSAYVEVKMHEPADYRLFSDGKTVTMGRKDDPAIIAQLNAKKILPIGDPGTFDIVRERGLAVAKERNQPAELPKESSSEPVGQVLFAGIGRTVREQIMKMEPESRVALFGVDPATTPDFFEKTPQFEAARILNASAAYDPTAALRQDTHRAMTADGKVAAVAEIPYTASEKGAFTGKVVAVNEAGFTVDRGFNRYSVVPLSAGMKAPKPESTVTVTTKPDGSVGVAAAKAAVARRVSRG